MGAPFEIMAQPFTLYLAPVATAYPEVDADPTAPWAKMGTNGDLNYSEDGVTVSHTQTVNPHRALGSAGPRKAFRSEEGMTISLVLTDVSLEQYAKALEHNTVATTAPGVGTAGYKKVGLSRGLEVEQKALLLKSPNGPYGDGWPMQYECPVVVQVGEPEVVYVKGEAAGIALEFMVLEDPDAASTDERFGRIVAQNAAAGT